MGRGLKIKWQQVIEWLLSSTTFRVSCLISPHFCYVKMMTASRRQGCILANSMLRFRNTLAIPLALPGTVPASRLVTDVLDDS